MAKQVPNESPSTTKTSLSEPTNEQARRMAGINFAKFLALGCFMYADRHDGQIPTDLAALDSDLRYSSDERSPSYVSSDWASAVEILYGIRGNQFEFVFRGTLHQVKNPGEVILMKEKQPTERSDGKFEKVYVFCDGHVQLYSTSDGNFDAWEKEHTPSEVPAPTSPAP